MNLNQIAEWDRRAQQAQAKAAQAFLRLVEVAETGNSGQARQVALFLAGTFNGAAFPYDLFELRALDVRLADDAVACIDALRWGRADLYRLIPHGEARMVALLEHWGLKPA